MFTKAVTQSTCFALKLSLSLFLSHVSLTRAPDSQQQGTALSQQFDVFFYRWGPAEDCSLVVKERSCRRRRRGRATVTVEVTPPPVYQHADSTYIVSSSVTALALSPATRSTNQPRWWEGFSRFLLADCLVRWVDDGWRSCSGFLVAGEDTPRLRWRDFTYRFCAVVGEEREGGGRLPWARLSTYATNCLFHFEASRNAIARSHHAMPWTVASGLHLYRN